MPVISAHNTDTGQVRTHNEDYIWIDEETGLYIVADGLGGHEAGEQASQLTATTAGQLIAAGLAKAGDQISDAAVESLMQHALEKANETVLTAARAAGQRRNMGATIVMALVRLPLVHLCHVGDARAYMIRDGQLSRLTEDDSYVAQLVSAGVISEEEARNHAYHSIVTKAIGQDPPLEPTSTTIKISPDDWLLMCSDGLTDMVSDQELLAESQQADGDPANLVAALVEAANSAGGKDNISIVVLKVVA